MSTKREQRYADVVIDVLDLNIARAHDRMIADEVAGKFMDLADAERDEIVRARNSAMRQRDDERRAKVANVEALDRAIVRAESAEAEVARLTTLLEQRTAALTRTIAAKDAAEAKVTRVEALIGNWEATKGSPESDAWTRYVAERVRNALSGDYSSETQAGGS